MTQTHYNIYKTRSFTAFIIQGTLFNPIALIAYALILGSLTYRGILIENPVPMILFDAVFLFLLYIIKKYVNDVLKKDTAVELYPDNYADLVSAEVMKYLSHFGNSPKLADFFEACVQSSRGQFILNKIGLDREEIINRIRALHGDPLGLDLAPLLAEFRQVQLALGEARINEAVILLVLFKKAETDPSSIFKQLLDSKDVSLDNFAKIIEWETLHYHNTLNIASFSPQGLIRNFGAFGRSWALGYTNQLDSITQDITEKVSSREPHSVVIHQDILSQLLKLLSRSSSKNALLIGMPGVGKKALIEDLAQYINTVETKQNMNLSRVLYLKTAEVLANIDRSDRFLFQALNHAESAGHIILVINPLSLFLKSRNSNIKTVLSRFLSSQSITVIGVDNNQNYHNFIKADPLIDSLMQRIDIADATDEETMNVLMMNSFRVERDRGVHITYKALESLLQFSKRYIGKGGLPGKAIELMNDAVIEAVSHETQFVLESHIRSVISAKTHININEMSGGERDKLITLESTLKQAIIGQNEAVSSLVNSLKRGRLDINSGKRPLGTFLFLGPTGVGKTETAKALANTYFGGSDRMIRLDMNEFANESSVYGIIGSDLSTGDQNVEGFLTKKVQDRPFSLILLDEIEKAHKNVLNIFLQILDEGILTDNRGVKTDFRNTIIIATSNAGALFMRDYISKNATFEKDSFKKELIDTIIKNGQFAPEFVNRFDSTIVFYPLSPKTIQTIAANMLRELTQQFQDQRGIELVIDEAVVQALGKQGYSMDFGARELRRTLMSTIENYIADYMLTHQVKRGERIEIKKENLML